MKRSDIAAIVFIASTSVIIAYFVANAIVGSPSSKNETVKTADPITAEIEEPKPSIFNEEAINPTVEVTIGDE